MKDAAPTLVKWALVIALLIVWIVFNYRQEVHNCHSIAANRAEGHNRYSVLRDFIKLAAARTKQSGNERIKHDPTGAALDFKYSALYGALLPRLHDLPDVHC